MDHKLRLYEVSKELRKDITDTIESIGKKHYVDISIFKDYIKINLRDICYQLPTDGYKLIKPIKKIDILSIQASMLSHFNNIKNMTLYLDEPIKDNIILASVKYFCMTK